jgi:cytoskeletal protein CcmA (bactofilin family)
MASEPGELNALLGHGTDFNGKLSFEGTVRIDGRFQGEVLTNDVLIIGEGAEVHAEIEAGTLIVKGGVVVGNIHARESVEIHAPGRVLGDIVSPSLYIGKGVVFDGRCQMKGDGEEGVGEPLAGPPPQLVETVPLAGSSSALPPPRPYPSASPTPAVPVAAAGTMPVQQAWPPVQIVPPVPAQKRR